MFFGFYQCKSPSFTTICENMFGTCSIRILSKENRHKNPAFFFHGKNFLQKKNGGFWLICQQTPCNVSTLHPHFVSRVLVRRKGQVLELFDWEPWYEVGGWLHQGKPSYKAQSRWWFQTFAIFIPILGEMIQFDEYFSNGVKPPTSQLYRRLS